MLVVVFVGGADGQLVGGVVVVLAIVERLSRRPAPRGSRGHGFHGVERIDVFTRDVFLGSFATEFEKDGGRHGHVEQGGAEQAAEEYVARENVDPLDAVEAVPTKAARRGTPPQPYNENHDDEGELAASAADKNHDQHSS